ncbi:MAG: ATP-binding protein [bacterium]
MNQPRKRRSIRHKITLIIIVISLCIIFIGTLIEYLTHIDTEKKNIGRSYRKMADLLSVSVTEMIEEQIQDIRVHVNSPIWHQFIISHNKNYQGKDQAQVTRTFLEMDNKWKKATGKDMLLRQYLGHPLSVRLKALIADEKSIGEIFLTDKLGGLVAASGKTSDFYQADEDWWQETYYDGKGRLFVGDIEFDDSSKIWSIPIGFPIRNNQGEVIGICKAIVDIESFFKPLRNFRIGTTGHAIIIDDKARILFYPGVAPMSSVLCSEEELNRIKLLDWGLAKNTNLHKKEIILSFSPLTQPQMLVSGINWYVAVMQESDEAFTSVRSVLKRDLLLALFLVIVLVPVGSVIGGKFVEPISELKAGIMKMSQGDMDYKLSIQTGDEVQELSEAFNDMLSQLKQERERIIQEELYTESIISSMVDTLIVLDESSKIIRVNPAALKLLGYKEEDLRGHPLRKIFMGKARKVSDSGDEKIYLLEEMYAELLRNGSIHGVSLSYITKDGEKIPVDFSGSVIYEHQDGAEDSKEDKKRGLMGVVCVARDIRPTQALINDLEKSKQEIQRWAQNLEKKVEERTQDIHDSQEATLNIMEDMQEAKDQLEESNKKISIMVESMIEGVIMLDLSGDIVILNSQARGMLGFWIDDDITRELLSERLIEIDLEQAFTHCREKSVFVMREVTIHRERDMIVRCEFNPIKNFEGLYIGTVAILRDVTREKELDTMKTDFVSTVSHELRTPLTIIREAVSQVFDGILGDTTEQQRDFLGMCLENVDRLRRIIDNLLDMSKIEARKVELKRDKVNIIAVAKKIASEFSTSAREKGLELKEVYASEELEVYIDKDRIVQVFNNLLSNAIKFTKEGYLEISIQDQGGLVLCSVADTGRGIARADLPNVFSKFQQFGRLAGPGEKGTGLGLSIAKGIVEMHGGNMWVESELDKGTRFSFNFPKHTTSRDIFAAQVDTAIRAAVEEEVPVSVLACQIKNMDEITSQMGEGEASAMFNTFARLVRNSLRRREDKSLDDFPYIFVMLPNTSKEHAVVVSERLKEVFRDYLTKEEIHVTIDIDYKVTTFPEDGNTGKMLLWKMGLV